METSNEDRIFRYLDGEMSPTERSAFETELNSSDALKKRVELFRSFERVLKEKNLQQPSFNFTSTVLQRLTEAPTRHSLLNGLLLVAGVTVVGIICALFVSMGMLDESTTKVPLETLAPIQKYVPEKLPEISLNGKMIVNSVVMISLALALIVLDRTVLRPYFQERLRRAEMT